MIINCSEPSRKKQRLHLTQVVGLFVGIVGVYLIVNGPATSAFTESWWYAVVALVIAQVFNAFGALESRKLMVQGVSAWFVNGFQMTLGSLGLIVVSLVRQESFATVHDPMGAFGSLVFLILIGSMVGWGCTIIS